MSAAQGCTDDASLCLTGPARIASPQSAAAARKVRDNHRCAAHGGAVARGALRGLVPHDGCRGRPHVSTLPNRPCRTGETTAGTHLLAVAPVS